MKLQRWYLQPAGALSLHPAARSAATPYIYDPAMWVYTNDDSLNYFFAKGDDATKICTKPEQAIFDSPRLKKPVRLDGPIFGRLFASTDCKDTDWTMNLLDVHPDGVAVALGSGIVRARFRNSFEHPTLLQPGRIYSYKIDLWQMGMRIPAGHKLRVVVSSTLFPDTDRNLNTGESIAHGTRMQAAHQKIFHDPQHRSYIELPIVTTG